MGLSSKQVSSRGLDWKQALLESQNLEVPKAPPMRKNQQQQMSHNQQAAEALKCPRCESTNTKFCYYNNYNKSQPRHFCRACKRHWTKGGTLRNVPVGGGRKNKRVVKKSSTTTPTPHIATIQPPLAVADDQKHMNSSLYQGLTRPPPFLLQQNNLMMMSNRGIESKDFGGGNNNGIFLGSSFPPPPPPQSQSSIFPFSSSSFDTNTCSVSTSLQSSNVYNNCGEELRTMEETTISSMMPISTNTQPWEMLPTASATTSVGVGMQMSNCWSWEDLDSLVSTDLNNNPWDDDIKPN